MTTLVASATCSLRHSVLIAAICRGAAFDRRPRFIPAFGSVHDPDNRQHHWHLDQHADNRGECGAGLEAEQADRGSNGELDFAQYQRVYMRGQVAELNTTRPDVTIPAPSPRADLWVGVFDTMRRGYDPLGPSLQALSALPPIETPAASSPMPSVLGMRPIAYMMASASSTDPSLRVRR